MHSAKDERQGIYEESTWRDAKTNAMNSKSHGPNLKETRGMAVLVMVLGGNRVVS